MNSVKINISIGELFDKVSILEIKLTRIKDNLKQREIKNELNHLLPIFNDLENKATELFKNLKEINEKLWDIEDKIRIKEKEKVFDDEFISLARSVYITNDKRFELKNEVNQLFGSDLKEVKSYEKY
jgi:predicted  nucleic acid-binding Zn-ribbon protein